MFWKTICGDMDGEVARVLDELEREAPPVSRPVPAEAVN
jgi:hypothetical protein